MWGDFLASSPFKETLLSQTSLTKSPALRLRLRYFCFQEKLKRCSETFTKDTQQSNPTPRRDRVLLEFSQRLGKPAPTKVVAGWGVGGRQDRGGREGREEPGREDRQQAFVLASSSASAEIGPSNCTS